MTKMQITGKDPQAPRLKKMKGVKDIVHDIQQGGRNGVRAAARGGVWARIIEKKQLNERPGESFNAAMIRIIRKGIKAGSLPALADYLDIPKKDIYGLTSIPYATFKRREQNGKLNSDESDRVYRYAHLVSLAEDMMHGDRDKAVRWLKTPKSVLQDETPLEHATSEIGAREVENLIGRIRHGVYS